MRFAALATDYDGRLAWHGTVEESTCQALIQLKTSGRKLLLVTGRELSDLFSVFAHCSIFDLIVAENGAVLHHPDTEHLRVLAPPPPQILFDRLRQQAVRSHSSHPSHHSPALPLEFEAKPQVPSQLEVQECKTRIIYR